jgi:hypothetical protein
MKISGVLSIASLHLTQKLFLACLNPTMSRIQGDNLRVFPSMSQYGWCFVVDQKDDTRRGWVPGMSCHFHLTYFNQHFNLECFFTRNKRMQPSMA